MPVYELYLPQERPTRNPWNGRYMKGHVPDNKGKKWSEYMGKRAQKRAAKGWKNLDTYRPKTRPDTAGRCRKAVIAVNDEGKWCCFSYVGAAAQWCGGLRENVGRCCRMNDRDEKNTDHKYMGYRFYYEQGNVWMNKINN